MAQLRRERGLQRVSAILLAWLGAMWWGIAPWRREYHDWATQIQRYIETAAAL